MSSVSAVESVADRLVRAREAAGFSTAQLARRVGVRTQTLSSWESGRAEPRANRLVMMAGLLSVSPTWLLMGQGQAPIETRGEISLIKGELAQLRATHEQTARLIERLDTHLATLESRALAQA